MVTPAARREAVAHLGTSLEVSERRACSMIAADRSAVRDRAGVPTTPCCVRGCGSWRTSAGGLATAACMSYCGAKAGP